MKRNTLEAKVSNHYREPLGFVDCSSEYYGASTHEFIEKKYQIKVLEGLWYEELQRLNVSENFFECKLGESSNPMKHDGENS